MSQTFAGKLRSVRTSLGLTQAEFGARCGIRREHIAHYEAGQIPFGQTLERIANAAGLTVSQLVDGVALSRPRKRVRSTRPRRAGA